MTPDQLKKKISKAFASILGVPQSKAAQLLPKNLTSGKAYEAHILSVVCEKLRNEEGCNLVLRNGTKLVLKTSHGPINRQYPWIEVSRNGNVIGEIFTDVEFLTLSYGTQSHSTPSPGHFHELDIVLTKEGLTGRPKHSDILIAVECKNTGYTKGLLKEILGIRRELSLLQDDAKTIFNNWPRRHVPANPCSCLLVYTTSNQVANYSSPGETFGIDFIEEQM